MPSAEQLTPESRFFALFVGPKHSGKTVAACSIRSGAETDNPGRVSVEDFDGRIRGILGAPWINKKNLSYDFYPPKLKGMVEKIETKFQGWLVAAEQGQPIPETEIIDSITAECLAMIQQSLPITHAKDQSGKSKGKTLGGIFMPGPEDYGMEASATYSIMAFLRSIPIKNVIVTAHTIDRFGKSDPDDPYSESIVVGEKLSIRDKIGENIKIYFDHIFRFDRRVAFGEEKFYVKFRSDLACTSYAALPSGEIDITGKDFYREVLIPYLKGEVNETPNNS